MDLESLVIVLVVVYLTECLVLVRRGALLCLCLFQRWSVVSSDRGMTTSQGAWRLLSVLPEFPTSYQTSLWLFSATPGHLASWTSASTEWAGRPPQTARVTAWSDMGQVAYDRRKVLIDGVVWFEARSDQEAVIMAERLTRLKGVDEKERGALLEEMMRESLDGDRLKRRREEVELAVRWLRVPAWILLLYVVLVCPWLIHQRGLSEVGWWLLGGLYVQSILISVLLYVRHRKLYRRLGDERFARVVSAALSPVSAMRSPDMVARHGLEEFHPWCVIRNLCPGKVFRDWAGRMARDHVFPRLPEQPEGQVLLGEVERLARAGWVEQLKRVARADGLVWEELLDRPVRAEEVNRAYCVRCHAQFVDVQARCAECGGRRAEAFDPDGLGKGVGE